MAWPAQAKLPTKAAANITAAAFSQANLAPCVDRKATDTPASAQARIARTSQSLPKSVCDNTVQSTSWEYTSATDWPLIEAAVSTSQAAPEAAANTRLIHAIHRRRLKAVAASCVPFGALRKAGSAM